MKELLDMKLHEKKQHDGFEVLRVFGGWIYTTQRLDFSQISSVFVPERSEK